MCDANYKVLYASFGSYGYEGDAGVYERSDFLCKLRNGELNLPEASPLPGTDVMCPSYFVGDSAFPLSTTMMKPFGGKNQTRGQRIFNYRYLFYLLHFVQALNDIFIDLAAHVAASKMCLES